MPGDNKQQTEQQFSIQPHPAKTNDPADLNRPKEGSGGGGLASNNPLAAYNTPGPYIPSKEITDSLGGAATSDELKVRSAELNRDK